MLERAARGLKERQNGQKIKLVTDENFGIKIENYSYRGIDRGKKTLISD